MSGVRDWGVETKDGYYTQNMDCVYWVWTHSSEAGHVYAFRFATVSMWIWCSVILSSDHSITSAFAKSLDSEYYFVFLSGPASESAGVITHNDSFNIKSKSLHSL